MENINNNNKYTTLDTIEQILMQKAELKICKDEENEFMFDGEYNFLKLADKNGIENYYYVASDDYNLLLSYKVEKENGEDDFVVRNFSNELRLHNLNKFGAEYRRDLLGYIDLRDQARLDAIDKESFELVSKIRDLTRQYNQLKEEKKNVILQSGDEYSFWCSIDLGYSLEK